MDKLLKIIIWLIIPAPVIYAVSVWNQLPSSVPVHYNYRGEADVYGSKDDLAVIIMAITVASIVTYALITLAYRIDPKKNAERNKSRLLRLGFISGAILSAINCLVIYNSNHHTPGLFAQVLTIMIGLLYCFTGNYIFNIKPNYFAGIRLPWALENEDNWRKTHLLGGKLYFYGGLLLIGLSFILAATKLIPLLILLTVAITGIILVYSFLLYKKEKIHTQANEKNYE